MWHGPVPKKSRQLKGIEQIKGWVSRVVDSVSYDANGPGGPISLPTIAGSGPKDLIGSCSRVMGLRAV